MPYYYLALSLNEFETMTSLVEKLLGMKTPIPELQDKTFVTAEVQRIKMAALRDVPLFHVHYGHYIRVQLSRVYQLMIMVHEIRLTLPDVVFEVGLTHYQFQHCNQVLEGLLELENFFCRLGRELKQHI